MWGDRWRNGACALAGAVALSWHGEDLGAQKIREAASAESANGLSVTAEVFCSETKLRTGNVRLRWTLASAARAANKITALAGTTQRIDTTVFAGGFDKGLYVSLPVPGATPAAPVAATPRSAQQKPLRAYQIQLIEAEQPRALDAADSGEIIAVVENLEPGVNYTWRVTVTAPSGELVSAPVTVPGPTCPADLFEAAETPRRRP